MPRARTGRRCVVAVDGPAGAGKSTVARAVAARLGYIYVDTGAMYRAVALLALRHRIPPDAVSQILARLDEVEIRLEPAAPGEPNRVYLDGEDVTDAIREPEVNAHVSEIARHAAVRERLVALQRAWAREGGIVMDGRDIGTVVLPDADVKVFLVADVDVRAKRRWRELLDKGHAVTLEEVRRQLIARDVQDRTRAESPLRKADDAVVIDTSDMDIPAVVDEILRLCRERTARGEAGTDKA